MMPKFRYDRGEADRLSVELTDRQANTTVEIKGLPHDSIVIRAEDFKGPLTVFQGSRSERKRADFVIVSNEERGKWIICIETQAGNSKDPVHVEAQLKGAPMFYQLLQMYRKVILGMGRIS